MKAEQDLLAVGYTALLGTSMAAKSGEAALLNRFSARYVRECQNLYEKWNPSPLLEAFAAHKERKVLTRLGASAWYPAGGGGVMAALWHFFDGFGLGFEMDLRKLPIRQETVEVCEVFDLNPYRLQSQGCILLTASSGRNCSESGERAFRRRSSVGRARDRTRDLQRRST
ncbi:MAG: hydrogenase expression/formation protein HypE [Clostridium fessum]